MTIQRKIKISDDDFRRDFEDSVIMEELTFDTVPADILAEFESIALFNKQVELNEEDAPTLFDQLRDSYL